MRLRRLLLLLAFSSPATWAASAQTQAVEFYNTQLGHYFLTADTNEALAVDAGAAGTGWVRTGRSFGVWTAQNQAPADAHPVCRFYSTGANSHFYTAQADECASLIQLEATQHQAAAQAQQPFTGWTFESKAFFVQTPSDGQCPAGTQAISRVYNKGATNGEGSNHRFVSNNTLAQDMVDRGWAKEGIAFCAPDDTSATSNPTATGSVVSLANTWSGLSNWEFSSQAAPADVETRVTLTLAIDDAGAITGTGNGCTITGTVTHADAMDEFFTGTLTLAGCTDDKFNGSFPVRMEHLGGGLLEVHVHQVDAHTELDIEALLSASTTSTTTTPPTTATPTSWSGTVAWIAVQEQMKAPAIMTAVNQTLSLSINGSTLSGSGFGCTFTGTVQAGGGDTLSGMLSASGCTDDHFNGSYTEVQLERHGPVLAVELEKETMPAQGELKVRIVGTLMATSP